MLLIKAIDRLIEHIDAHMSMVLKLSQDAVPEAHIAKMIAKAEVPAEWLIHKRLSSIKLQDNDLDSSEDSSMDELARDMARLQIKPEVLDHEKIEMRFGGTWQDLMNKDFKAFGSELINNLKSESPGTNKLIILARMKHLLHQHKQEALAALRAKEEQLSQMTTKTTKTTHSSSSEKGEKKDESKEGRVDNSPKDEKDSSGRKSRDKQRSKDKDKRREKGEHRSSPHPGAQKEKVSEKSEKSEDESGQEKLGKLEDDDQGTKHERIDHQLYLAILDEFKEARHLASMSRNQGEVGVENFSIKHGKGRTEGLLGFCEDVIKGVYAFIEDFDRDSDNKHLDGTRYQLSDFLPSYLRSQDPIVVSHWLGMDYVLENMMETARYNRLNSKPLMQYGSLWGLVQYAKDTFETWTYSPELALTKRNSIHNFFKALSLQIEIDAKIDKKSRITLRTIDTHGGTAKSYTPLRGYVFQQDLPDMFETLHAKVHESSKDDVRIKHKKTCSLGKR